MNGRISRGQRGLIPPAGAPVSVSFRTGGGLSGNAPRGSVSQVRAAIPFLQAVTNPRNTVYSVKRFMGRGADDPETRRLGTYSFVPPTTPEEAKSVRFKVRDRVVSPVEVSGFVV